MKEEWKVITLGDICETTQGVQIPKSEQINKQLPNYKRYLYISDFKNEKNIKFVKNIYPEKIVTDKDLIVVNTGASAGDIFKGIDGVLSNNLFKVTFDNSVIEPKFIFYFVFSEIFKSYQNLIMRGTANPHMGHENFKSTPFKYPIISEQKRIVAILDKAFEAINKAKENVEKNIQNARELFQSYLQNAFDNPHEGCVEKKLSDVCLIKPPKYEARNKLKKTDFVSFVPMEDLGINQKELIPIKERALKEVEGSYTYFANDDVLLAKITPCFENGKISIAKNLRNGIGFGSSEFIVFRVKKEIDNEYLYYFFLRKQFKEEGAKRMMGAVGHKRVSKDFIENYIIYIPLLEEQRTIVAKLDALSSETNNLEMIYEKKLADLEELKKSILQKAFNGEY